MAPDVQSVSLDSWVGVQELRGVEAAFLRAGFDVDARPDIEQRIENWGAASLPWGVLVVLGVPLGMFFAGFVHAAGEDAYAAVKRWVIDIWEVFDEPRWAGGWVTVEDSDGTQLSLPSSLPQEALDALCEVDWRSLEGGELRWDSDRREWRHAER